MSERANTQLLQQAYQPFTAGNVQSFLNLLAHDVLWQLPEMANVQDVVEFEPEEFIAQGDKVIVLGRFTMHVKLLAGPPAPSGYTFGPSKETASVPYANM